MIDKLEYLLALARERHFGRAAAACGTSQPTFSAGIKHLEESLGVLLVERGSRFHGFTEAGERTLGWARRIVGDARALRQDVGALRSSLRGQVRIAAIPTALPMLPDLTAPFAARHPDVRIAVLSRSSDAVLAALENLEADAGVTYLDSEPLGKMLTAPLYRETYRFVCPAGGAYAGRDGVTWAEIAGERLALLSPEMQNRRIIDRAFHEAGAEPNAMLDSDSITALFAHLRTGRWCGILPAHWLEALGLGDTALALPLASPEVANTVGLVVPPRDPLPILAEALMAEARRAMA
jgi:DNA-binding transcriptional LysR family regulator